MMLIELRIEISIMDNETTKGFVLNEVPILSYFLHLFTKQVK